jgi:outer membrane protein insertion porin family
MNPCDSDRDIPDSNFLPFLHYFRSLSCFLFCLVWLSLIVSPGTARSADRETILFLPLKIHTAVDFDQMQELADKTVAAALQARGIETSEYFLLPRTEAEQYIDYQGVFPPSFAAIQALGTKIAQPRYVAAGSLTRIGQKISIDVKLFDLLTPSASTYYYQDGKTIENFARAMDDLIGDIAAYTGRDFLIASIGITGNARIDSGAIRRHIASRAGDRFDPKALNADLKNVHKMGYFEDVAIDVIDSEKGKEVVFKVTEKPVIGQILIEGTKELKEETVQEAVTITSNSIINPKKVRETVDNILALYKEKGYYNTEIDTKFTYPKPERVDVRFIIDEGPKIYTKEIKFSGNKAFKTRKLKKVIETSTKGLFSWVTESGLLKMDVLEQDVARLTAYYHNHGYIEAKVGEPDIVQEGKWLYVTFNIYEGERYRVGTVDLTGDLIVDKEILLYMTRIREEEYLSRKILREDILRLTDMYAENGFAFAEVNPVVEEDKKGKIVNIVINIAKGDLVYVNRIMIKGNTRTRDKVIRRELAIKEKDVFNSKALRTSHESLQRLDYFEEVNINPEAAREKNFMDVTVEVKEKRTGAFSIGAGYSSAENFIFMGEISQDNFLGKGQRLALQANLGGISTRYSLSFTEPHYKDTNLLIGIDLYKWEKEYTDYTKNSNGGGIRIGYPIWGKWYMGLGYGYDNADLTDIAEDASQIIKDSADIHITSFVTASFSRDTRNRRFNASRGSKNFITTKYAGGPLLGGDAAFTKVEASTSWYYQVYWELISHFKLAAGQILESSSGKLPVFEKFYLGGIRDIRGFETNTISPKDPGTDEQIGGKNMWYMNAELAFPVVKDVGLNGVVFFDAGNVYADDWDFDTIKKSVGGGVRWMSPMGPLRLEYGYIINPEPDEGDGRWDFTMGAEF